MTILRSIEHYFAYKPTKNKIKQIALSHGFIKEQKMSL